MVTARRSTRARGAVAVAVGVVVMQFLAGCAAMSAVAGTVGPPRAEAERHAEDLRAALRASAPPPGAGTETTVAPLIPTVAAVVAQSVPDSEGPRSAGTTEVEMAGSVEPAVAGALPLDIYAPCVVGPVPPELGLDAFYAKACVVGGVPVVSSAVVRDGALVEAARIVAGMLSDRPDLLAALAEGPFRLGIIGLEERAVDLPEYRDLPANFSGTDWDAARAYGATPRRPLAAVPEENLLCLPDDTYPGQSVLPHELAHSLLDMVLAVQDSTVEPRIVALYGAARTKTAYRDTYALTNADEYWAEGVQDFFDASRAAYGPGGGGDGYDGPIASRETLRTEDPGLYTLIAEVFSEMAWSPTCPR